MNAELLFLSFQSSFLWGNTTPLIPYNKQTQFRVPATKLVQGIPLLYAEIQTPITTRPVPLRRLDNEAMHSGNRQRLNIG
jgi:hypothetical protein